jgi:hypothetical protein
MTAPFSQHQDMASETKRQFWRISPGEAGYLWREQKLNECIAVGWSYVGDIAGLTRTAVRASHRRIRWSQRDADLLYTFANEFQKGDKVVVSASGMGIFALGTVMGDYCYNDQLEYKHTRPVRWDTTFWHPVDIDSLNLRGPLYNKFHGRSSGTFRKLSVAEWEHVSKQINEVPTPFRNLSMWGGLIQSPEYENEVIILFSQMLQHLKMRIAGFGTRFPDAIIQRKERGKWRRLNVEFEVYSSGFQSHMPVPDDKDCRTIICWENDDWRDNRKKRGFKIIALKDEMEKLL